MKEYKMETGAYEAPKVEVMEVQVEKGFALSGGANTWGNGGIVSGEAEEYYP